MYLLSDGNTYNTKKNSKLPVVSIMEVNLQQVVIVTVAVAAAIVSLKKSRTSSEPGKP